jgi:hypothetical protein
MKDLIATSGEDQKLKIWKNESSAQKGATWKLAFETSFNVAIEEKLSQCTESPKRRRLLRKCFQLSVLVCQNLISKKNRIP